MEHEHEAKHNGNRQKEMQRLGNVRRPDQKTPIERGLLDERGVSHQHAAVLLDDRGEVVPHEVAGHDVQGVGTVAPLHHPAEHEPVDRAHQKRRDNRPEHAQSGRIVLQLEVLLHQNVNLVELEAAAFHRTAPPPATLRPFGRFPSSALRTVFHNPLSL